MSDTKKLVKNLDEFLGSEITSFERSAEIARSLEYPRWAVHCQAVVDSYRVVRSWIHVNILVDEVETGDIFTTWFVKRLKDKNAAKTP